MAVHTSTAHGKDLIPGGGPRIPPAMWPKINK